MSRWLILDGCMGAAGDMLTASLLSLFDDPQSICHELNQLGIPGVKYDLEKCSKQGIEGYMMHVLVHGEEEGELLAKHFHEHHLDHHHDRGDDHPVQCDHLDHHDYHDHDHHHPHPDYHHDHSDDHLVHHDHHDQLDHHDHHDRDHHHHHSHTSMAEIKQIIDTLHVSDAVKENIQAVFEKLARAESEVHGAPVDQIHFHEVGQMDALADISAVCCLVEKLAPEKIFCTPIHVGSGQVHCAHGWLPIPAPATALLLKGIPIYSTGLKGELCTPTGAALLAHFVDEFGPLPLMISEKIGTGFGMKEFDSGQVNMLRSYLAKPFESDSKAEEISKIHTCIYELSCNLDDISGEQIGYAISQLFQAGALDVYTTAIGMKKSRPGIKLSVLCKKEDKDALIKTLFKETSTLGIREQEFIRHELKREVEERESGKYRYHVKKASGYGLEKEKIEYDDLARLADAQGVSLEEMRKILENQRFQTGKNKA